MNLSRKKGPIYLQMKDMIKKRILQGEYPLHTNIPPEPQLEKEFGVSKITVRRAIEELANEGYVRKQSGKGTEVIGNKAISKLSKGQGFTEILMENGHEISKETIEIKAVPLDEKDPLANLFGESCYQITRIFYLDDVPYIYFSHYLPSWLEMPREGETYNGSLYSILADNNIQFQRFIDEFDIELSSAAICNILQIKAKPLLKRIRYSYDENERCVEYSEALYDTAIHRYVVKFDV